MTDTEDPNIATLREALAALYSEMNEVADYEENEWRGNLRKAEAAVSALASTLAERDRRIAEQQSLLRRFLALTFEGGAPENLIAAARAALPALNGGDDNG